MQICLKSNTSPVICFQQNIDQSQVLQGQGQVLQGQGHVVQVQSATQQATQPQTMQVFTQVVTPSGEVQQIPVCTILVSLF